VRRPANTAHGAVEHPHSVGHPEQATSLANRGKGGSAMSASIARGRRDMPNTRIKLAAAIAGQYGTPSRQRPAMSAPPTLGLCDLRYLRPLATARSERFACIPWTNSLDCRRATGWRSWPSAAPAAPVCRWCASPSLTPGHTVVNG
jgi:hypothetical protein